MARIHTDFSSLRSERVGH